MPTVANAPVCTCRHIGLLEGEEKITLGSQRERMRLGYCRDEITRRVYERSDRNTVQKLSSWNKVHLKADWMHPEAVGSSHL